MNGNIAQPVEDGCPLLNSMEMLLVMMVSPRIARNANEIKMYANVSTDIIGNSLRRIGYFVVKSRYRHRVARRERLRRTGRHQQQPTIAGSRDRHVRRRTTIGDRNIRLLAPGEFPPTRVPVCDHRVRRSERMLREHVRSVRLGIGRRLRTAYVYLVTVELQDIQRRIEYIVMYAFRHRLSPLV